MSDTMSTVLTSTQIEEFVERGYTVLRQAFDGANSAAWMRDECARAGYDLDDPTTWQKPYLRLPTVRKEPIPAYAPKAWAAVGELLGGVDTFTASPLNLMAVNLAQGADRPFEPPTAATKGWHKDGWHFRHFLDSPEQGFLGIPLLTDVLPQGGATFIAAGSVAPVARFLAAHSEGVLPDDFPTKEMLSEPGIEFIEATGAAGDFYLLHPFLLHAVSQNVLRRPRAISNVLFELREPLCFDRADGKYSPVERAVLHGLRVERYPFVLTGERYRTPDYGPINAMYR